MLSQRLLACGATLACATLPLVVPAAQAYAQPNTPRVTTSSSAALPASSDAPERKAVTAAQARQEVVASDSHTRTHSNTATSSGSTITTFEALVLIAIITIIFLPASIIYVIFYRQARKDVHDMPNYTGVNGPQYGVTGYPQGSVPPRQSRYAGFNPLWSRNNSYSGGPAGPGTPGAHGYGTPTGQGPVYGTQPSQGGAYGYGTQPGQASAYGYGGQPPAYGYGAQGTQGPVYGTQGGVQGYGTAPSTQDQTPPFGQAPGQNYPSY